MLKFRGHTKRLPIAIGLFFVTLALVGLFIAINARNSSPVPKSVQKAVSFPVYYPDQKKLPKGYRLDETSFTSPVKNGVSYEVKYGDGKKIVFSGQAKPSNKDLEFFYRSYLPLRYDINMPIGKAEVGAYNNKGKVTTLVSLPINNSSAWLVITAPSDINQDDLEQVLRSIKR